MGSIQAQAAIPVVDLSSGKEEIVKSVKMAATTIGFFQLVNHGVPEYIMDAMLKGTRKLHELPEEDKLRHNIDPLKTGMGRCFLKTPEERISAKTFMTTEPFGYLPEIFGDVLMHYTQHMKRLGTCILEALSDALGLKNENFNDMVCANHNFLVLHYYPPRSETASDLGLLSHADRTFLTILLQDLIGGLEVFYEGQWLNIPPSPGALMVNIGDLLKLLSNEKLVSSVHRVRVNVAQPRVSVPYFFLGDAISSKKYGPIKELCSETDPPLYRETTYIDYISNSSQSGADGSSSLMHLRL